MKKGLLTGNQLKIIALIAMTVDHIGKLFFPTMQIFSVIGRLAYPIFGFLIAEGCFYTKNRLKYILMISGVGALCQLVYFFVEGSLYQCILVTFALSVLLIFSIDKVVRKTNFSNVILAVVVVLAVFFVCEVLPRIMPGTDFRIDYGFFGVLLPVAVYFTKGRILKVMMTFSCLVAVSFYLGGVQGFSLLAIPLLLLYDGSRGRYRLKYLFYIYYPLHLAVIYVAFMIIRG